MLKRIKYISRFATVMTTAQIDQLVEHAENKNRNLEVTGILVAMGRMFFQIIEGPTAAVDDLYSSILSDSRHESILLLSMEWGVRDRIFPDWSMRKVDLGPDSELRLEPLREILESIIEMKSRVDSMTGVLERAVWAELTRG